jgi:hypothetical protein
MICLTLVTDTLAHVVVLRDYVDAALGFPKPGTDVGGGTHAPAAQTVTKRWAELIFRTSDGSYAYPFFTSAEATRYLTFRTNCQAKVTGGTATAGETVIASMPDPVACDTLWDPPDPITGVVT